MAYILRTLARVHTVIKNGKITTLKDALAPCTDAAALTPLGAPLVSGFGVRPRWLCNETSRVVAVNVWRARANERSMVLPRQIASRGRVFAQPWQIDCKGSPAKDWWQAECTKRFKKTIAEANREERIASTRKASNPKYRRRAGRFCEECFWDQAEYDEEQVIVMEAQIAAGHQPRHEGKLLCPGCKKKRRDHEKQTEANQEIEHEKLAKERWRDHREEQQVMNYDRREDKRRRKGNRIVKYRNIK